MSNKKQDGGPAFPFAYPEGTPHGLNIGMTLRDYFAAKVLQGLLANPNRVVGISGVTRYAYEFADTMLKARDQQTEQP